ncbi:MAG: DUF4038 domain-containing protein [Armatimonadota bacterium]|nr:DUF4038 domain-containing protein [Armatimonadota bacterium]
MLTMICLVVLLALAVVASEAIADPIPLWGRWSQTFAAVGAAPETALQVELTAPNGQTRTILGYWDGGQTWGVRFRPDQEGTWRYRAISAPAVDGLHGRQGTFSCQRTTATDRFLQHGPVRVAANGYYLEHSDGTPFFWLGDTVWNGPMLSARDDWEIYLGDRVAKRFTLIQFNALAPWRTAPTDAEGQVAFTGRDPIQINPRYFQRLDERMDAIAAHGLLAVPVLIWSLTAKDPGHYLSEADCIRLARYQVARYGAYHVVWILAGDNHYKNADAERWKRIGRAVFDGQAHAPVTTHPTGMNWPWESWREERWLDILGYQSGHGDGDAVLRWIHSGPPSQHWQEEPHRPRINLEPPYEGHRAYESKQPHTAYTVRRACYWSLLNAPTAGLTYGGHGVWSWHTAPGQPPTNHGGSGVALTWREALDLPGSTHMKYLSEWFTSLPWWTLRPAQDMLASQPRSDDPARFVAAARSETGDIAVLYLPVGGAVTLKPGAIGTGSRAEWFDPRSGQRIPADNADNAFRAPDEQDWVLVLRSAP